METKPMNSLARPFLQSLASFSSKFWPRGELCLGKAGPIMSATWLLPPEPQDEAVWRQSPSVSGL